MPRARARSIAGRAFAMADDNGDFGVGDAARGDTLGEGFEIRAAAGEQDANALSHKSSDVSTIPAGKTNRAIGYLRSRKSNSDFTVWPSGVATSMWMTPESSCAGSKSKMISSSPLYTDSESPKSIDLP